MLYSYMLSTINIIVCQTLLFIKLRNCFMVHNYLQKKKLIILKVIYKMKLN